MPSCDFFAFGSDHRLVLDYVFEQLQCRVFEASSEDLDTPREFSCLAELQDHFAIDDWDTDQYDDILLKLYPERARGFLHFNRVELMKRHKPTGKVQTTCEGWGLVQLQLRVPRGGRPFPSLTNHNSESRAHRWADTLKRMGDPKLWDWTVVNSFSQKLNRFIRSNAVYKIGTQAVLPVASRSDVVAAESVRSSG